MNKHNGYSNYPTWLLASTIDNYESLYNRFHNFIRNKQSTKKPPSRDWMRSKLMHMLQDYAEKSAPRRNNSFWDGIFNDVLKEQINYYEIAELMLDGEAYENV